MASISCSVILMISCFRTGRGKKKINQFTCWAISQKTREPYSVLRGSLVISLSKTSSCLLRPCAGRVSTPFTPSLLASAEPGTTSFLSPSGQLAQGGLYHLLHQQPQPCCRKLFVFNSCGACHVSNLLVSLGILSLAGLDSLRSNSRYGYSLSLTSYFSYHKGLSQVTVTTPLVARIL